MIDHLEAVQARISEIQMRLNSSTPQVQAPGFSQALSAAIVPAAVPTKAGDAAAFDGIIQEAAERNDLDPGLLRAVVHAESGFNPNAVSRTGAQGLMQLMPGTARALGVTDAFDPAQNVSGGARYLRHLLDRFGDADQAIAAYNAGPGSVERYNGIPPFEETQNYVRQVKAYWQSSTGR